MPFQSPKQRRYMHANLPEIANRWEAKYGLGGIAELNAQLNSLPEYYLPKNQGGLIPSHEAGIYGLAEGGQLVKPGPGRPGYGGPHETEAAGKASTASSSGNQGSDQGHTRFEPGSGYYGEPVTPREAPPGEKGGAGYISPEDQRTLDIKEILSRQEEEKTEKWEKAQTWNKPETSIWKKIGMGAAIITGVAPLLGFQAPAAIQTVAQLNALHNKANSALATFNKINKTDHTLESLYNKVTNIKTADKKIMESLPKGHPERIALEAQMKIKTPPKGPDGEGVNIKYTTEEITDTNDANADKAALEQKYREMDEASLLAWQRQQEMQAKKEAYLRNFRQMYMSAKGGRVPAGYNTGGLSNLFRLKNV